MGIETKVVQQVVKPMVKNGRRLVPLSQVTKPIVKPYTKAQQEVLDVAKGKMSGALKELESLEAELRQAISANADKSLIQEIKGNMAEEHNRINYFKNKIRHLKKEFYSKQLDIVG